MDDHFCEKFVGRGEVVVAWEGCEGKDFGVEIVRFKDIGAGELEVIEPVEGGGH